MRKIFMLAMVVVMSLTSAFAQDAKEIRKERQKNKKYAVDLGLSVKWASCNVGATKPEEYGDYFAWGEVKPKKHFGMDTYKYIDSLSIGFVKYCINSSDGYNGFTDYKIILDTEDDAATVNWGKAWRMPTKAEYDELRDKCTWIWITQNGVKGYKVIGSNGNSIFLPAADFSSLLNDPSNLGVFAVYWSSVVDVNESGDAYCMMFSCSRYDTDTFSRYVGCSIRPVCP